MPKPQITLLGVYKLDYDEDLIKKSIQFKYGIEFINNNEYKKYIQDELDNAYLIELLVENPDNIFSLDDISQNENDQAPYDEYFFSTDYKKNYKYSVPNLDKFKILFWFHYLNIDKALNTTYGELNIQKIEKMPEEFKSLKPYEPIG